MKKKPKKATIALFVYIVLAIILLIGLTFMIFHDKKTPTITRLVDFSCPSMTGFSFKYPEFAGWEVSMTNSPEKDKCVIYLKDPLMTKKTAELQPRIEVNKYPEVAILNVPKTNPHQVRYGQDANSVSFWLGNSLVSVEVLNVNEQNGFSNNQFFESVISSFQKQN